LRGDYFLETYLLYGALLKIVNGDEAAGFDLLDKMEP
jgi:hypothetical protein